MNERVVQQSKETNSSFRKLLPQHLDRANLRRQLTKEEIAKLSKLETITEKLKRGENGQNR